MSCSSLKDDYYAELHLLLVCIRISWIHSVLQRLCDKGINIVNVFAVIDSKPIVKTQNGAIVLEDYE